jgi:uncharacterized membrane protein YgdD (TMEM256/DUF423 family)
MSNAGKTLIAIGASSAAIAVALGAFAAHGLKQNISPEMLSIFEMAARYQMYHAFALTVTGFALNMLSSETARLLRAAGWCFLSGTLLFSGSLYLLVLFDQRWLGAITPLGGLLFIGGWCLFAWSFFRSG